MTWERKFKSISHYIDRKYKENFKIAKAAYDLGARDKEAEGKCYALGAAQLKIVSLNFGNKKKLHPNRSLRSILSG